MKLESLTFTLLLHLPVFWNVSGAIEVTLLFNGSKTKQALSPSNVQIKEDAISSPSAVAWAVYDNNINKTGWGNLYIKTSKLYTSSQQAYAAGYLEAYLTHIQIYQYWLNYARSEYDGHMLPPQKLRTFMKNQHRWVDAMILKNRKKSQLWQSAENLMSQYMGLVDGISKFSRNQLFTNHSITHEIIYLLNSVGDLEDLNNIYITNRKSKAIIPINGSIEQTDCTAFIKILPQKHDILFGHTTWRRYYAMLRIYKVYEFGFAPTISMSSSPGLLHSKDDFYMSSYGITVMETTNSIYDKDLYLQLKRECLFSWQRAMISNWLADTGSKWTSIFAKYNSGTYNNQWMILNNKVMVDSQQHLPSKDILWIIEQIPGRTRMADVTEVLVSDGYWSSYNIPYFKDIYVKSGYKDQCSGIAQNTSCLYSLNPRARIMKRDQANVNDLSSLKLFMQENKYQRDPLSYCLPSNAISSRYDLPQKEDCATKLPKQKRAAFGGIDSKVSSSKLVFKNLTVYAICGPTKISLPPFTWSDWENISHEGLPNIFNFTWIKTSTTKMNLSARNNSINFSSMCTSPFVGALAVLLLMSFMVWVVKRNKSNSDNRVALSKFREKDIRNPEKQHTINDQTAFSTYGTV